MVSRSESLGNAGKGLGSGWVTSRGLGGEIGAESIRDCVSGGADGNGWASNSSWKGWSVIAESEVPSTGSGCRAGGRDRVMRLGAVMATESCLRRSSL